MILGGSPLASTPLGGQSGSSDFDGTEFIPLVSAPPILFAPIDSPWQDFAPVVVVTPSLSAPTEYSQESLTLLTITPQLQAVQDGLLDTAPLTTSVTTISAPGSVFVYTDDARAYATPTNTGGLTLTPTNKRLTRTTL